MSANEVILQPDGTKVPKLGFGTFPYTSEVCTKAVNEAIEAGYRMIDTATYYENFDAIAKALQNRNRKDYYLISKVWHDKQDPKGLQADLKRTLKLLKTDYLDGYLLHWPNSKTPIDETLQAMDALRKEGKIRHIGLSNVNVNHVKKALKYDVPITWVQIEMHPFFCDFALLDVCKEHGIIVQAWRPLDLGRVAGDPLLSEIEQKHGKTSCQIALRWILQHDCVALPGSQNPQHIQENIAVFDFTLSAEEMEQLDRRARSGQRLRLTLNDELGFSDELDFTYEQCWPTAK